MTLAPNVRCQMYRATRPLLLQGLSGLRDFLSRRRAGAELAAATQAWQRVVAGLEESGAEAELRATERVRQAALPLYINLFPLISNQPAGATCLHIHCMQRWQAFQDAHYMLQVLRALAQAPHRLISLMKTRVNV